MRLACRILAVGLIALLVCLGCGGKPPRQVYEEAGGFSWDPPAGWQVAEFEGFKYRVAFGPVENEFAPNIWVDDEEFAGTLAAYADAKLEKSEKMSEGLNVIGREDFRTQDNGAGVKIVTETEQQGVMLRETFFLFSGSGDWKYVVTCTALADGGAKWDATFAESMKTFRVH